MAVREFSSTDSSDIQCETGAMADFQYGTVAAIVKLTTEDNYRPIFVPHTSAGTATGSFLIWLNNNLPTWFRGGSRSQALSSALSTNVWYLVVMRKPTGTVAPRFSRYDFSTGIWNHENGNTAIANLTPPGSDGSIRFTYETEPDNLDGRIAARAVWSNALPWSADTSGDTALEAAGLQTSLQNWLDTAPSGLWSFSQTTVSHLVVDLTGNGANQRAITGTSVITGDDPPGFDFTLSSRWRKNDGSSLRAFMMTSSGLIELR